MEPLAVFILLPVAVGIACAFPFRDLVRASSTAALASPLAVYLCLQLLAPNGGWNWLGAIMVAPLASGLAVVVVLAFHGRPHSRN